MSNDPISQLPEPYRSAWSIFQEPYSSEIVLSKVLESAKAIANANWGMIALSDEQGDAHIFTLPDIRNERIPFRHLAWLAYSVVRMVIRTGQGMVISSTDEITEFNATDLINEFVPLKRREEIISWATRGMISSIYLDIPEVVPLTALSAPIKFHNKVIGAVYLSRPMQQASFDFEAMKLVDKFLSLVGVAIKNVEVLENSRRLAGEFPSLVAHEIKNPVTSIKGYATLLLSPSNSLPDKVDLTEEKKKEFLQKILLYTERLNDMILAFMNQTRIEGGFAIKDSMALDATLSPVIEKYRSQMQIKHQSLILDINCDMAAKVDAGYVLSQVIDILIKNAYLYTPEHGQIKINVSIKDDKLSFKVSDTGLGLTEEEMPYLFQKFYRSTRPEIREVYGIGMGLYIAKGFIGLWNGQIGAEGSPNQGSTFWFTLPLKRE